MASNITTVTRQAPTQQPSPKNVTTGKAKASAFDRFLIKLGLKTIKPAKDPLKTLVGSWNRLPKPRVDFKTRGLKAMTVIRHSGTGEKLNTAERGELLSSLNLKMKPCRADQVPSRIRDIILTQMTDKENGTLVSSNMLRLLDSGSLSEAQSLLMNKILADNPWMEKSGIAAQALMDVARDGMDAMLDGLMPRAMQDAEKTRKTVDKHLTDLIGDPKKVGALRLGLLQHKVKNQYTPKSDIEKVIGEMQTLRSEVDKNTKLLDYDRAQFLKRIDLEIDRLNERMDEPIKLPGKLSKLDWGDLSDDALRALKRLDERGFLADKKFLSRFGESWLAKDVENANKTWKHVANGDPGLINEILGAGHLDDLALVMKLKLADADPDSDKGKAIALEHQFMIGKRNLTEILHKGGFFGKNAKLPSSFRDIRIDDKFLSVLMKIDKKLIPERDVILGDLVLMQFKVDGKDLSDPKVLADPKVQADLKKMLKTLGLPNDPKKIQTWAKQGFRSSQEIAGVLKALNKFVTKLGKSEQAVEVFDEIMDSSPKAFAQRGLGDMLVALLGYPDRTTALKSSKSADNKIKTAVTTIKNELDNGSTLTSLKNIANARDRLVSDINNLKKQIDDIENGMKSRLLILNSKDAEGVKPNKSGRYPGLDSGLDMLDVLRLQDGIDKVQKRLGKGKTNAALEMMIAERNRILNKRGKYDLISLHTRRPTLDKTRRLSSLRTPEKMVAEIRKKEKVIGALVEHRLARKDVAPLKKDLKKLESNLKTIDKTYNKAMGRVKEERLGDFVHMAVLRVFADSGKDFTTFKLSDFKKELETQLKAWGLDDPALKVIVDRLMDAPLSHDVIKKWSGDVQKQDERSAKVSKEIKKLLANKQFTQALNGARIGARIGVLMDGLKRDEGVSVKFGVTGSVTPGDLPIGVADAKLSVRVQAAAFDSINIRNTGNGYEVLIKGGGNSSLSVGFSGLMGLFEGSGNVKAEKMSGAQFTFKTKAEATAFLTDLLTKKITENTLSTVQTIHGVTDGMAEVSLKVKAGYSNEKEKDVNVPNLDKTATFGLAVEIQAKANVSAQYTKGLIENNAVKIQTHSRTYEVNARVDATLKGKVKLGDQEKGHQLDANMQYKKVVTHGMEVHRSPGGTILADTCVKTGMRAGDLPLVTLSALLPDDVRSKLDPAKLQTLLDALDGNRDKMITLESRLTDDAHFKINELRSKGARLIRENKKTEGRKLMQEAEKLLGDPKSYAPSRLVVDADVFKTQSQKVKSLLGGKVEIKQFAVGERTFGSLGIDIKNLLTT